MCSTKEIIFVSDVNILDIVLDTSEKSGCEAKKGWLLEFSLRFRLPGGLRGILACLLWACLLPSRLCFFCLRLLNLLGPLVDFVSYSCPHRLSICSLLRSPVVFVLSLGPSDFMHDPMHQHYVCDWILCIIFASRRILMEMLRLRHLVLIWAKDEMDIAQL